MLDDPYRFLPTLGEMDLHLINEGRHEQLWEVLGARVHHYPGALEPVTGTSFAVWAPSARAVRLKADFNSWDGREHPMRQLGSSGVWELFVPDVGSRHGVQVRDPRPRRRVAREGRPDGVLGRGARRHRVEGLRVDLRAGATTPGWPRAPTARPVDEPMSVYEMHLGSWKKHHDGRYWSWAELADELPAYVADLGFTHVELMPVMQHPFGGSWGYHVTSYFAPDSRFGDPDGFRLLVDRLHQAGIGVILDWVPGHFATDEWALARFDGTPLYEDPNPQRGWHKEWGSHIFNFGRREVRNFLYANALYWLEEFHADGLRVDGVASMLYLDYAREDGEWTPNIHGGRENLEAVQFLQEMNATVYKRVPGVATIAEESTSWPGVTQPTSAGGLGFGFKWNMGWMHDSLDYLAHEPVHRAYHHGEMTFSLVYAFSENFVLPLSHDEVVHGKGSLLRKMPGDRWQQLANLRAYLAFMWAHPGKQLLVHGLRARPGVGVGRVPRARLVAARRTPSTAASQTLVRDLNAAYVGSPGRSGRATTTRPASSGSTPTTPAATLFSFVRARGSGDAPTVVCVANFAAVPHDDYRLGLPVGRRVGGGAQHRRRDLRRLRRRQLRRGHGGRGRLVRPAGARHDRRTAAGDGVAAQALSRVGVVGPLRCLVTEPTTAVTTVAEGIARISWTPRRGRSTSSATTWSPRSSTTPGSRRWSTPTTRAPSAPRPGRGCGARA